MQIFTCALKTNPWIIVNCDGGQFATPSYNFFKITAKMKFDVYFRTVGELSFAPGFAFPNYLFDSLF